MSWQDDPVISNDSWQNDPVVDAPTLPESFGHAALNNVPLGGQIAAGVKSLANDKGYSQNLEDWNKQTDIDKKANPISYGVGAGAGAVGSGLAAAVIPGAAEAPIVVGGLMGAGSAMGNTDVVKHPGRATAEAAGGGALGAGTSWALGKMIPYLAGKFASHATTPEASEIAMNNPDLLKNIPNTEDLAEHLPTVVKNINKQIGEHMDIAKDSLSSSPYLNDGAITKDEIFKVLGDARKELGGIYTSEGKKAASALENLGEDLTKTHNTVSQKNIYSIYQKIDNEIPWDKIHSKPEDVTAEEWAMVNVRRGLRNLLGEKNPDFGAMMEPVSILEKDKGDLISHFGLKRDIEGIRPGNQTVGKLANALVRTNKTARPESERILENLGSSVGEDIKTPLQLQSFEGPTAASPMGVPSRVGAAVTGAAAGHGLGLGGMGLGAVAGQRILRQPMSVLGRQAASKVIQNIPGIEAGGTQAINQAVIDYLKKQFQGK